MLVRVAFLIIVFAGMAGAGLADDVALCADDDQDSAARIAACERALPLAEDRGAALVALGLAQLDAEQNDAAAAHFTEALALDVERAYVLGRRAVAYGRLGRYDLARLDLEDAIALEPDRVWFHYRLGRVLNQLHSYDEAVARLEHAIGLDRDYYWSWLELATAHDRTNNSHGAALAYHEAARIRPFRIDLHNTASYRAASAELLAMAAYHARISYVLEPNQLGQRDWLLAYLGERAAPELAPLAYHPPDPDRAIRYFSVRAPVDQRDDVTKSIEDMIVFFGGSVYPIPETAAIQRISYSPADGDRLMPLTVTEKAQDNAPARTDPLHQYRGLFSFELQPLGPGSPVIVPQFTEGDLNAAWPLQDGTAISGAGRMVIICAESSGMQAFLMGCLPDLDISELGTFDYELSISTQTIHVPMGVFDTYRLDLVFRGEISIMGRANGLEYSASYWIAPALNSWVQRIFTVGDTYVFHQALELVEDD